MIGVGEIGYGYWGPNLVRNVQATPGLRLRYLCDLDVERARRVLGEYSTVQAVSSLDAVLADPDVAAVAHLRTLVQAGEVGYLQYLHSVRINLGLVQRDVDVLWDLAPHDLSIFDSVLPDGVEPIAVSAHGSDPIGAGHACVAHLTIQLSNGAMAHVHVNWLSPTKIRTLVVGGSRRTVVWDDLNPSQRLSVYDRGVDTAIPQQRVRDDSAARERATVSYRLGDMVAPALPEREALRAVMEEFAAAITERRAPLTDGRAGLRVLALLESATASMTEGGVFVPVLDALAPADLLMDGAAS